MLATTAPVAAQETSTVVDSTGIEITLPADPQRIVSLHDTSLTVALLELGIEPVGSHGRTRTDGTPYIRSSATATGRDFANAGISSVGNLPPDAERVAVPLVQRRVQAKSPRQVGICDEYPPKGHRIGMSSATVHAAVSLSYPPLMM